MAIEKNDCVLWYDCTLPPKKSEAEKISAILHMLEDMRIADAHMMLDACKRLLLDSRVPKNLRVDFSHIIDG